MKRKIEANNSPAFKPASEGMPSNFIEVNDVACKTLSYTREELLKLSPADIILSEKPYEISGAMKKVLSQRHTLFERVHITKDSEKFPIEINSHLFDLNGDPTILSIARNITERKKIEEELQNTIIELRHTQNIVKEKEKLAIIGQMAAGMAHEIKNPLTAINGLAYIIRKNYSGSKTLVSHLDVILKEANQANNTITKFLQITHPRKLSLNVVEECIELLDPQFIENNIKLKYEGTKDLLQCMLDRAQLKQVILNMCQNAIDAMAEGGVIVIKTDFLTDENEVYIEIKDIGCGIPSEQIKNIGVPF